MDVNGCHAMIRGLSGRFAVFASKGGVVVVGAPIFGSTPATTLSLARWADARADRASPCRLRIGLVVRWGGSRA